MTDASRKSTVQPLGVVGALASGFEAVNARLELILLPLVLDLYLWLGPHISAKPLVDRLLSLVRDMVPPDAMGTQTLEVWQQFGDLASGFNLFAWLSTAPLGLPSLLAGRGSALTPAGVPIVWMIDHVLEYALLWGAFVLTGLFLGALYFGGIAQQVRESRLDLRRLLRQVWGDWARLTALAVLLSLAILAVWMPFQILAALFTLVNVLIGGIVSVIGTTLVLWILFFTVFAVHGIVLQRRGLFGAVLDSLRLVQRNLPATATLYVVIVLLSLGLGELWNIPKDDSWFLLLGVVGHALVSTALVVATFVYYQDRYRHWLELRQTQQARASAGPGSANRNAS